MIIDIHETDKNVIPKSDMECPHPSDVPQTGFILWF